MERTRTRTFIEDIQPRYKGDTIRKHIIPGTFPRHVTEIEYYDEEAEAEKGEEILSILDLPEIMQVWLVVKCYVCHEDFNISFDKFSTLKEKMQQVSCYNCYAHTSTRTSRRYAA